MSTSPEAGQEVPSAEDPERRPAPLADVDLGAHLEAAVLPVVLARRRHRGRRVVVVLAALFPVAAAGDVVRVQDVDLLRGDGQQTVGHRRVVGLVPLQLLVADEAFFVAPVRGIGRAAAVELVGPGQVPGAPRRRDRLRRDSAVGGAATSARASAGGVSTGAARGVPAGAAGPGCGSAGAARGVSAGAGSRVAHAAAGMSAGAARRIAAGRAGAAVSARCAVASAAAGRASAAAAG